jgi:hypothetical protein
LKGTALLIFLFLYLPIPLGDPEASRNIGPAAPTPLSLHTTNYSSKPFIRLLLNRRDSDDIQALGRSIVRVLAMKVVIFERDE